MEVFASLARQAGLNPDHCPILLGDYVNRTGKGPLSGHRLATQLLDGPQRVTAVIAGSDILAAGALQLFYERRIRVPDDLSLIGYDDSMTGLLAPALSSVAQPYAEIGTAVVSIVQSLFDGTGGKAALQRVVATHYVRRNSVGPCTDAKQRGVMRPISTGLS